MPCSNCGHLLYVDYDDRKLRCPECKGLPLEDDTTLERKIEQGRKVLSEDNQIQLLKEYSKEHLLLQLITLLNQLGKKFYNSGMFQVRDFVYLNYLIRNIYEHDDFGDELFNTNFDEIDREIRVLMDTQAKLINTLNQVEDQFLFCVPWPVEMPNPKPFFSEYWFVDSEYQLCYERCLRSLIGGSEKDREVYEWTCTTVRDFDRPAADEIDSLYDFADCFYETIASLKFVAAANDTAEDIYTTFPEKANVFDLKEFLGCLDTQFESAKHVAMRKKGIAASPSKELVNTCGRRIFDDNWNKLKNQLIIGENNLDAHPFLFRVNHEEVIKEVSGRDPLTKTKEIILYPKYYAFLVRLQLFPLLRNGSQQTGHDLLSDVTGKRGDQFERNIHEYLTALGYESYHSAELSKDSPNEIDIIVVNSEEIWFIECKYLMPKLKMNSAEGINEVNEKFDYEIFKQQGSYKHSPSGDPFNKKVERWLDVEGGTEFQTQVSSSKEDTEMRQFKSGWLNLEPRMMVVSNIVPSYVEKQNIEFMTDIEFIELLNGSYEPFELVY